MTGRTETLGVMDAMRVHFISSVAVFATAVAVLAACGGTTSSVGGSTPTSTANGSSTSRPSGGGGPLAACSAVSQPDAVNITGDPGITANTSASSAGQCLYSDPGQPLAAGNGVYVQILHFPNLTPELLQSALAQNPQGATARPISGIGDSAFGGSSQTGGIVLFAKGSAMVTITGQSNTRTGTDVLASIESVAMRIAGQL
jgi:hypothetical protein